MTGLSLSLGLGLTFGGGGEPGAPPVSQALFFGADELLWGTAPLFW